MGDVWGMEQIARVLHMHPAHVRKLRKRYENTEPLPVYFRIIGRGKDRRRLYWSTEEWLLAWLTRILPEKNERCLQK